MKMMDISFISQSERGQSREHQKIQIFSAFILKYSIWKHYCFIILNVVAKGLVIPKNVSIV